MATSSTITQSLLLIPPPNSLPLSNSKPNSITPLLIYSPNLRTRISHKSPQLWRVSAAAEDALTSEAPVEEAQQIVSAAAAGSGDEGVSTVVSALLFAAFIGLSLLTIGVLYLAVQDFLQKREREKFEKEAAAKKKKGGKKRTKMRASSGPRGFGQKIEEDDDDDD